FLDLLREIHSRIEEEVPHLDEVTSLVNARATRGSEGELIVEDLMEEWPETPEELLAIETYALGNSSYRNMLLSEDGAVTAIAIKTNQYSDTSAPVDFEAAFDEPSRTDSAADEPPSYLTDAENTEVVQRIGEIVEEYRDRGVELVFAGSPVVMQAVKVSMQHDMGLFIRLTLLSIAVLLFVLFRRASAVAIPIVVVVLTLVSTVGLMVATGTALKLPTMIMPSFLLAVGIGDSVHILTLFYRAFDSGSSKEDAIAGALEHSGLPVTLTSLTTAGGLLSFAPAALAPISDLGTFAPLGVMIAWFLSLVLLPALLAALPVRRRAQESGTAAKETLHTPDALDRILSRAANLSADRPWAIVATSAVLLCVALGFASQIRFAHNPLQWLPEGSAARHATEQIDRDMRGSVTMEVILTREGENAWYDPDALRRLEAVSEWAEKYHSGEVFIGKAFSALDVLKETNRALNENRDDQYRIPDTRELIAQEFLLFENSGSDDLEDLVDSQFSKLRLTLKAPFVDAVAYARTIPEIQSKIEESLGEDTQITVTGLMPLLFRTMNAVNITMTRSYVLAFVVITGLMVLMIGSVKLGFIAMIPNLLPIALAMGLMGIFDMPLDTFTLLIASISLGLAVDDTIHFMHNYRRYYLEFGDSRTAIQHTLATTGRAMLFTTLVLASSFTIFMFSSMSNLFNFGAITSFAISIALLADILLAPALMHLIHEPRSDVGI
ncbi:MAG: MMPL family transporter, partial [Deltaproteobacteria bacterium]|nr:MMPL family transporter [Deltaproteobacteria bacterium]